MLGRLAIFLAVIALCILPPLYLVDYDDGMSVRLFLQVFVPLTVFSIIIFGFCDQLFFKLKLYDEDVHNM